MTTTTTNQHAEYAQNKAWSGRGTLDQLVKELDRQKESRIDFVADTRQMFVWPTKIDGPKNEMRLCANARTQVSEFLGKEGMSLNENAFIQMAEKSTPTIPIKFLKELREVKPLTAADLLSEMLRDSHRRFVRCLDGNVRAFLSDRYRVLDNFDLAFTALDTVRQFGGEVIEASLSESHMRIKFTSRQIWEAIDDERKAPKNQWFAGGMGNQEFLGKVAARTKGELPGGPGTVHPVVTITNSETGNGSLAIRIGILRAICFNLATVEDVASQVHLGNRLDVGRWSEETRSVESQSIMLKCRDAIQLGFDKSAFRALVAKVEKSKLKRIESPSAAMDNIVKVTPLADGDRQAVLEYFLRDYDSNAYGLGQAVARFAQDTHDADKAAEYEDLAGKLMTQPALVGC